MGWFLSKYYLRFMDPRNTEALASKEALEYFGIVDEYVGGAEHAVLHLLYARFGTKFSSILELFQLKSHSRNSPFVGMGFLPTHMSVQTVDLLQ